MSVSVAIKLNERTRDDLKKIKEEVGMPTIGAVIAMLVRDYNKGNK